MEIKYENEEFDKVMEKYDFDSPIEVTLFLEEDPPEPVLSKDPLISSNTNVPNIIVSPNSSEVYKRAVSNTYNANNKVPNAKKKNNCNGKSAVEENNLLISVNKTVFPDGRQEKTQDIPWQVLDAVADNLIHITKYHYYNFVNINVQMEDYERLTYEYVTLKHYYFYLSYNTTVAILLPRENDILFINEFIHRVITIANRKLWFHISYEILGTLIRDMLIWTKQKKLNVQLSSQNHERGAIDWSSSAVTISNGLNHSNQVLNRPFDNGTTTNYLTQRTIRQPDIVHETHLPDQVMNISPHIRHITNYSAQGHTRPLNISPPKNYPMQDIDNQTSIGFKNNATCKRTKKCHNYCSETVHSQPEINMSPNFIKRTNHLNQKPPSPLNIHHGINRSTQGISRSPYNDSRINHSTETITSINNNEPKTNKISTYKTINTNTNKILLSTGPPNQEITISVDTEILANINQQKTNQLNNNAIESHVNEARRTKSVKRRKTNDTSSSYYSYSNLNIVPHHNDNNIHYKKNNCSATAFKSLVDGLCHDDSRKAEYELFNTDTLRSSISRDSGFASPVYGSFRNEQTIDTPTNEELETPIISHVTSMNPNAIHLNIGSCKVCGATTNNMCIGCYKEYYCSFLCQTKEWENHKYLCSG